MRYMVDRFTLYTASYDQNQRQVHMFRYVQQKSGTLQYTHTHTQIEKYTHTDKDEMRSTNSFDSNSSGVSAFLFYILVDW